MSRFGFVLWPEPGHIYPALRVAQSLVNRGHSVTCMGFIDSEMAVRSIGLEFVPVLAGVFPQGSTRTTGSAGLGCLRVYAPGRVRREVRRLGRAYAALVEGQLDDVIAGLKLDLLVTDTNLAFMGIVAKKVGVPVLQLTLTCPQTQDGRLPPLTSRFVPGAGSSQAGRSQLLWLGVYARRAIIRSVAWLLRGDVAFARLTRELARSADYPVRDIVSRTVFGPLLREPELVLCPQVFGFPGSDRPNRYFGEAAVVQNPEQVPFPWERLDDERPLVFCTLGSQSDLCLFSRRFFRVVMEALAQRPDLQAVIAVGRRIDVASLGSVPPNVTVVNWAPHTAMLKRASLMVNHAGLGTVKECILLGVPMLVFPCTRDQPGNAARVAYHGLGMVGDIRRATPARLLAMVDALQADSGYGDRVRVMGRQFRALEEEQPSVRIMEHLAEGALPSSAV